MSLAIRHSVQHWFDAILMLCRVAISSAPPELLARFVNTLQYFYLLELTTAAEGRILILKPDKLSGNDKDL